MALVEFVEARMSTNFRRWAGLVVVCFGQLMIMVDTTIVNVALPFMQRDLGFTQANLTWVVNAYLIAYGSFLLVAGRLGDLIGRRAVFLAGVFLFTVASMAAGLAPGPYNLIASRFVQGIGASLSGGVIIAIIVSEFRQAAERAQAMSIFTLVIAGGGSLGLLAGGLLTQLASWHWIFFINLPIGIVTIAFGAWLIRENEGLGLRQGIDLAGATLITSAVMLGVYGIVTAADNGWTSTHTIGFEAAAAALIAVFIAVERRVANPILPMRVIGIRSLTGASLARAFVFAGISTSFFAGVLYLQHIQGFSAFQIGLAFLPTTAALGLLSAGITARLMGRFGARNVLFAGMPAIVAALALLALAGEGTGYFPGLLAAYGLLGIGGGMTFLPLLTISMSEVPVQDSGVASGFSNQVMQTGGALGLAAVGAIASNHSHVLAADGYSLHAALTGGYDLAFLLAAGIVIAGLSIVATVLRPSRRSEPSVANERTEVEAA